MYSWWWAYWCPKHVEAIRLHTLSHLVCSLLSLYQNFFISFLFAVRYRDSTHSVIKLLRARSMLNSFGRGRTENLLRWQHDWQRMRVGVKEYLSLQNLGRQLQGLNRLRQADRLLSKLTTSLTNLQRVKYRLLPFIDAISTLVFVWLTYMEGRPWSQDLSGWGGIWQSESDNLTVFFLN
jgi:hypothetical protein